MGTTLVQILLCCLAGVALWQMLRVFAREERLIRYLVIAGFSVRAIGGALLFWVSWLRLPFARSLQLEHGIWFFAPDGRAYFHQAAALADQGPLAIIFHVRTGLSITYVQTLAVFTYLFGRIASVAILLNLFCYIGMCLVILKWLRSSPASRLPGLIALGAVSLLPSAMLWAMAPLKDTLFQLLVVCIIAAGALWQRAWRERPAPGLILASASVLIVALFAVTGLRWYVGFVVLIASAGFLALTALTAERKILAVLPAVVLFFLLSQALVLSASTYLPGYIRVALAPWRPYGVFEEPKSLTVATLAGDVQMARRGFELLGGATSIGIGGTLAKLDPGRMMVPAPAPVTEADFARTTSAAPPSPAQPAAASSAGLQKLVAPHANKIVIRDSGLQNPVTPEAKAIVRPGSGPRKPVAPEENEIVIPDSTAGRMIAGGVAVLLPSVIARKLGLLEIGGGRGLWWFTDIDTLFFDVVVLLAIVFIFRRLRWASLRNPVFWFVMGIGAVGIPLVYAVTNYGTLFRLRIAVFVAVALIPLALSVAARTGPREAEP